MIYFLFTIIFLFAGPIQSMLEQQSPEYNECSPLVNTNILFIIIVISILLCITVFIISSLFLLWR